MCVGRRSYPRDLSRAETQTCKGLPLSRHLHACVGKDLF